MGRGAKENGGAVAPGWLSRGGVQGWQVQERDTAYKRLALSTSCRKGRPMHS